MSQQEQANQGGSTTLEPPQGAVQEKQQIRPDQNKPKRLPPYAVIVLNDNDHTFDYVVELFQKVFGYTQEKCDQLAMTIHTEGKALVWSGPKEVAELKRDLVKGGGPDFYASKKVKYPLGVYIEPMPG